MSGSINKIIIDLETLAYLHTTLLYSKQKQVFTEFIAFFNISSPRNIKLESIWPDTPTVTHKIIASMYLHPIFRSTVDDLCSENLLKSDIFYSGFVRKHQTPSGYTLCYSLHEKVDFIHTVSLHACGRILRGRDWVTHNMLSSFLELLLDDLNKTSNLNKKHYLLWGYLLRLYIFYKVLYVRGRNEDKEIKDLLHRYISILIDILLDIITDDDYFFRHNEGEEGIITKTSNNDNNDSFYFTTFIYYLLSELYESKLNPKLNNILKSLESRISKNMDENGFVNYHGNIDLEGTIAYTCGRCLIDPTESKEYAIKISKQLLNIASNKGRTKELYLNTFSYSFLDKAKVIEFCKQGFPNYEVESIYLSYLPYYLFRLSSIARNIYEFNEPYSKINAKFSYGGMIDDV